MTYQRYSGDPRWITARFTSTCAGCSTLVQSGDRAYYFPRSKSVYGDRCGCAEPQAVEFETAAQDEAFNACL